MTSLLQEVQRHNNYSATISSILLSDQSFFSIKRFLENEGHWDEELQELETGAKDISLEYVN